MFNRYKLRKDLGEGCFQAERTVPYKGSQVGGVFQKQNPPNNPKGWAVAVQKIKSEGYSRDKPAPTTPLLAFMCYTELSPQPGIQALTELNSGNQALVWRTASWGKESASECCFIEWEFEAKYKTQGSMWPEPSSPTDQTLNRAHETWELGSKGPQ